MNRTRNPRPTHLDRSDVADILAAQPGNKGAKPEYLSERWIASDGFTLTTVHAYLPDLGVTAGKTGESVSTGPIIVDKNIRSVARAEGRYGAAPDFLVLDGQNRTVAARRQGPRAVIEAYVGNSVLEAVKRKDAEFASMYEGLQASIDDFLSTPELPGGKLTELKQYVHKGVLTQQELDGIRSQWRAKYAQKNPRPIPLDREEMVKIAQSLGEQAHQTLEREGKPFEKWTEGWVLGRYHPILKDVKGSEHRLNVWLATRPSRGWWDGVTGEYNKTSQQIWIFVPVDPRDFDMMLQHTGSPDWGEITLMRSLLHEMTHARDVYTQKTALDQVAMKKRKDEIAYLNQPIEVRARMQSLADMAVLSIPSIKREYSPKRAKIPSIPAAQWVLEQMDLWRTIEPDLTPLSRKKIMLGVERALRDAGLDTSGKGALPNPRYPTSPVYQSAKKAAAKASEEAHKLKTSDAYWAAWNAHSRAKNVAPTGFEARSHDLSMGNFAYLAEQAMHSERGESPSRNPSAGLTQELSQRIEDLLKTDPLDVQKAKALGQWFEEKFRFKVRSTPKGQKDLKEKLEALRWFLVSGSGPSQAGEIRRRWQELVPRLPDVARYFTDEGGKIVPRELRIGENTYVNLVGLEQKSLRTYAERLEEIIRNIVGWRLLALKGGMKIVLAGPDQFHGTAGGKYRSEQDVLLVRATPSVLKRSGGTYGSFEYIIVHEIGHRYERKNSLPEDFDRQQWVTSKYSRNDGEAFAELFAIGHFMMTGDWDQKVVERFETVMKAFKAPEKREIPPHLLAFRERTLSNPMNSPWVKTTAPDGTVWETFLDEGTSGWQPSEGTMTRQDTGWLDPKLVVTLPGCSNEQELFKKRPSGRQTPQKFSSVVRSIRKQGYLKDYPVQIAVYADGRICVWEGNHRLRAAIKAGAPKVAVWIQYFANSQKSGLIFDPRTGIWTGRQVKTNPARNPDAWMKHGDAKSLLLIVHPSAIGEYSRHVHSDKMTSRLVMRIAKRISEWKGPVLILDEINYRQEPGAEMARPIIDAAMKHPATFITHDLKEDDFDVITPYLRAWRKEGGTRILMGGLWASEDFETGCVSSCRDIVHGIKVPVDVDFTIAGMESDKGIENPARKAGGKKVKWAYHGTEEEYLPSIAKSGLLPEHGEQGYSIVWFADNRDDANSYGPAVIRFPWPKSTSRVFHTMYPSEEFDVTSKTVKPDHMEVSIEGSPWKPISHWIDPLDKVEVEEWHHFSTGHPVKIRYIRNTEASPYFGSTFQQDIEPAGRYVLHHPLGRGEAPQGWEAGDAELKSPLVLSFTTDGPDTPTLYGPGSWKARLHKVFKAKGCALTKALRKAGYDSIVTVWVDEIPHDTREIVLLPEKCESRRRR